MKLIQRKRDSLIFKTCFIIRDKGLKHFHKRKNDNRSNYGFSDRKMRNILENSNSLKDRIK